MVRLALTLVLVFATAFPVAWQIAIEDYQTLTRPPGASPYDGYGRAVAISGTHALVSASSADGTAPGSGEVYAYELQNGVWVETDSLGPSDPELLMRFGSTLAMDGTRALIGATHDDKAAFEAGAVYVFDLVDGAWTETAKLTASDAAREDHFGGAVALDGDRVLIAATDRDDQGSNSGAVYAFELKDEVWAQVAKLTPSGGGAGRLFGHQAALSGNRALISTWGSPREVYAFEYAGGNWAEVGTLPDPTGGASFGTAVALDGDLALVGEPSFGSAALGAVHAYRHQSGVWVFSETLQRSTPTGGDQFGYTLALDGTRALIRAPEAFIGSVYAFAYDGGFWTERGRFSPAPERTRQSVGISLGLSGEHVLVGDSYSEGTPQSVTRKAYAFDFPGTAPHVTLEIASYNPAPERGESVFFRGPSSNTGTVPVRVYYAYILETPDARTRRTNLGAVTLEPGQTLNFRQFRKNRVVLEADAPAGDYTVTVLALEGGRTGPVLASDAFTFSLAPVPPASGMRSAGPMAHARALGASPNPFHGQTEIHYVLPEAARVDLRVFDSLGREVAVLADGFQPEGDHSAMFDAADLPGGLYVWRLTLDGRRTTGRMTLVR